MFDAVSGLMIGSYIVVYVILSLIHISEPTRRS